jgi:S1-C subfamily serine protease
MNGTTIRNNDDLASYLEEHTLPGQKLSITVVRGSTKPNVSVVLGIRPSPT